MCASVRREGGGREREGEGEELKEQRQSHQPPGLAGSGATVGGSTRDQTGTRADRHPSSPGA